MDANNNKNYHERQTPTDRQRQPAKDKNPLHQVTRSSGLGKFLRSSGTATSDVAEAAALAVGTTAVTEELSWNLSPNPASNPDAGAWCGNHYHIYVNEDNGNDFGVGD